MHQSNWEWFHSAIRGTTPWAVGQGAQWAQVAAVEFHQQEKLPRQRGAGLLQGRGELELSLLPLSGALMEQIADRGDGSGAQDVKMQMVPEACLHQLTLEDSPKDCRGNFTRKSTKNLRPGGGLAGLGFLLLYTQCKNVLD